MSERWPLSSPRSAKEIRHYEFDLGDSGIEYAAGDALAVVPVNDEVFVADLLEQVGANGGEAFDGRPITEVLRTDREIRTPSKDLIADLVARVIVWAVEAIFVVTIPVVAAQIVAAVVKWAARILTYTTALIMSLTNLTRLVG